MTPAEVFDALDVGLDVVGLAVGRFPGEAADIGDQILDAISDALPAVERLALTPGWDAGDVRAVRDIIARALLEIPGLPTAEALAHAESAAYYVSRAVSAGLKQEAPVVKGRGRRRRRALRDVSTDTFAGHRDLVPSLASGVAKP